MKIQGKILLEGMHIHTPPLLYIYIYIYIYILTHSIGTYLYTYIGYPLSL